jgi:hypothetical protein
MKKTLRIRSKAGALLAMVAMLAMSAGIAATGVAPAAADTVGPITFESGYTLGSVNGQDGWSSTGGFDQAIVDNGTILGAPASFGTKSFRISNAVTSPAFGDQTFSKKTTDETGEATADAGAFASGTRRSTFSTAFDFASVTPGALQPDLAMSVSPDRGDGARMSFVRIEDSATGWNLFFDDYVDVAPLGSGGNLDDGCGTGDDFVETPIQSNVSTTAPHNLRIAMQFVAGPHNDVVKVYLDGTLIHTGTSWEDYFRYCAEQEGGTGGAHADQSRTVRSLMFRLKSPDASANAGKGFLIDGLKLTSLDPCTTTCFVNGATGDDTATGQASDPLKTIQAGVTAVTAGGTVNVAAGTYDASTTIPKAVALKGANAGVAGTGTRGAETFVSRIASESGPVFNITTADPVTIDGFRAQFHGTDAVGGLLNSLALSNKLTFKNNLVDNSSYVNVLINATSSATLSFTNNKFTNIAQTSSPGTGVIAAWGGTGSGVQAAVTFTGNTFTHLTDNDGVPAINFNTISGNVSLNTFQDIHQYGILLAGTLGDLTISSNLFDAIHNDFSSENDTRGSGIRTFGAPNFVAPVTITGNTFSNSWHGVRIAKDAGPAANVSNGNFTVVRNNMAVSNEDTGISVAGGTVGVLDATCNWWGSASGPGGGSTEGDMALEPFLKTSNLAGPCPAELPERVTGVGAVPFNDHAAKVVWKAPASVGFPITGYRVIPYAAGVAQPARVFNSTATTQMITGLTDGTSYRFTVAARNALGYGQPSTPQSQAIVVGAPGVPSAPTVVRVVAGQLKNTFSAPMNNGAPITSYSVTCASSNGGVTKTTSGKASPITVTGLTANRSYVCRVNATNSRGTGPLSNGSAAKNA